MKSNKAKLAYSVAEMADALGISRPVAYELLKKEGFPSIRISTSRIIIPIEPLKSWLKENAKAD